MGSGAFPRHSHCSDGECVHCHIKIKKKDTGRDANLCANCASESYRRHLEAEEKASK